MKNESEIKNIVKENYRKIAIESDEKSSSSICCGPSCCDSKELDYAVFDLDYSDLKGYVADADLKLGCGIPTEFAGIKKGNTVVDLGSGAGNDVFVARTLVGNEGKVIGVDFTEEMIVKANNNNSKLGFKNIEFKYGEIESIPLAENSTDVVISNCVLNLVPDKAKAFSEIYRILNNNGHFCVSDIVLVGDLPEDLKKSAELYAGCVSGALQKEDYLNHIENAGFNNIEVKSLRQNQLPDSFVKEFLDEEQFKSFKESEFGIFSITVLGHKN